MKSSVLLNDLLTKGAILGGVMLLANIAEMLLVSTSELWLVVIAALVSMSAWALFCYLAFRFTRNYAKLVLSVSEHVHKFTYGNGFVYVVTISMLAGVISALGSYFFLHHVIGYEEYIGVYVKLIKDMLAQTKLPASMASVYGQMIDALQSQPKPTFMTSLYSGVMSFSVMGFFAGLIIAIFTRRKSENVKQDE